MPTRYLKPGVRDSEIIDSLSPMAEVLFYRLLVTVDDFGRFDARPSMVKSACFPVKKIVTDDDCNILLMELSEKKLISVYMHESKAFLQFLKWDNVPRASESKYPVKSDTCTDVYNCIQAHTVAPLTVTKTETSTKTETQTDSLREMALVKVDDGFNEFWMAYPKKVGKDAAQKSWAKNKPNIDDVINALQWQVNSEQWSKDKGQFIPNPATYLNQGRWKDEPVAERTAF